MFFGNQDFTLFESGTHLPGIDESVRAGFGRVGRPIRRGETHRVMAGLRRLRRLTHPTRWLASFGAITASRAFAPSTPKETGLSATSVVTMVAFGPPETRKSKSERPSGRSMPNWRVPSSEGVGSGEGFAVEPGGDLGFRVDHQPRGLRDRRDDRSVRGRPLSRGRCRARS